MSRILVTGALGQIGSELVPALRDKYGADQVIAADFRMPTGEIEAPFEWIDVTQPNQLQDVFRRHKISRIYHMAALLSAVAEDKPQLAWEVNMGGLYNVLELARLHNCSVFFPSSIGAFGPTTPRDGTPQDTIQRPTTIYGVTKVSGELLCDYYATRFGLDTRGLRLPGLISYTAPPGGGTTDYAVEIFYQAVRYRHYTCFLSEDTRLDMMYLPDAIGAMIKLMEADASKFKHRNAFNVTAMNFTPTEIADEIRKHIPEFVIEYDVDPMRQAIADSWPRFMDDSAARAEWGWTPTYDLAMMTKDMLEHVGAKVKSAR